MAMGHGVLQQASAPSIFYVFCSLQHDTCTLACAAVRSTTASLLQR